MSAKLLGPTEVVPCENPVVLQCVVQKGVYVYINHPAFTNGDTVTCAGVVALVVFCSAQHLTPTSRFVGIVASDPTAHGKMHGHISVFVRGCVTMACDLSCLEDVRATMVTLGFERGRNDNPNRFVGTRAGFVPPYVTVADPSSPGTILGTLVEKGRAPSNEVRLILEPQRTHVRTLSSFMITEYNLHGGTYESPLDAVAKHFTLHQATKIATRLNETSNSPQFESLVQTLSEAVHALAAAVRSLADGDELAGLLEATRIADG